MSDADSKPKKYVHKTAGKVWIVLLTDRSVLGASSVLALHRNEGMTTFRSDLARQFPSEAAVKRFLGQNVNDLPAGFGTSPAEIMLKPRRKQAKRVKVETQFGTIKLREGETTFLDKVGAL